VIEEILDSSILATSEGARAEKMPLAIAFGATDFVSKPTEEYELRARVCSCLRLRHEIERRKSREREVIEASNQLSDLNQILVKMSLLDSLTSIPNRRCFDESLEQEWKRSVVDPQKAPSGPACSGSNPIPSNPMIHEREIDGDP